MQDWICQTKIFKASKIFKQKGFSEGLHCVLEYLKGNLLTISLDSFYVFQTDLIKDISIESLPTDTTLQKIDINEEICDLVDFIVREGAEKGTVENIKNKVRRYVVVGDVCFAIKYKGNIVGVCWAGTAQSDMNRLLGNRIVKGNDVVVLTRTYVAKGHRGKGLFGHLSKSVMNYGKSKGISKCVSYVGTANLNAIQCHMRIDDRCVFLYHVRIKVAGFSFNWFPRFDGRVIWERHKKREF